MSQTPTPAQPGPFSQSIASFLEQASSASPTPGGGSVAALVAALGASMTAMVANLTQGAKFAECSLQMASLAEQMRQAMVRFESLLEDDVQSFNTYMSALKLPKTTDEEKQHRREALEKATIAATEVPLRLAQECLAALESTLAAAPLANPHVLSDLATAAILLDAAGQSALLTADINIGSIKSESDSSALLARRRKLGQLMVETRAEIVGISRQRMAER